MNQRIHGTGHSGAAQPTSGVDSLESSEIHSPQAAAPEQKSRVTLSAAEALLSLPPPTELPNAVAPLTALLGARLTIDNPAWSGDPVPAMRQLQKTLVVASLALPEQARGALLRAIETVEEAVQMRLRWQQMRRSELEVAPATEPASASATGLTTTTPAMADEEAQCVPA